MRAAIALTFATLCVAYTEALATTNYVVSVDKLDDLRHGGGSTTTGANVRGYAQPNDGGGGHFVIKTGSCTDDDGVEILDTAGNCWHRQFSGPVDIRWYGLNASTHDIVTQFGRAFGAAELPTGNGTVTTGGLAIALTGTGDLNIPTGDTLDCQGTIGGVSNPHWSVPTLPSSIVLPPNSRIAAGSRSTLRNCNIRPSWFTSAVQADLTSTRKVIDELLHNFSGTGLICNDDGCSIENVAVYGFDVGIEANKSSRFYMNNVVVDSNIGIWWDAMAGASKNINLLVDPVITQPLGDAAKQELWTITAISSTPGECKLTLSGTVDVHARDTVWVYGIGQVLSLDSTGDVTMSSSTITNIDTANLQGVFPGVAVSGPGISTGATVSSVNYDSQSVGISAAAGSTHAGATLHFSSNGTGPSGCNGRWLVDTVVGNDVTLLGSSVVGPTTNATWKNGSNVMTVTSLANIAPGQTLSTTGSGILPNTVVNVLPATSTDAFQVILLNAASVDNLAPTPVTFQNGTTFTGPGTLILSAATRVWTATPQASGANVFVTDGTTTNMSTNVTGLGDTTRIQPGMSVAGPGIAPDSFVYDLDAAHSSLTLNQAATATGTASLTFSGCGYPGAPNTILATVEPWKGNCAATAFLMGGPKPDADGDEDQGLGIVQAVSKGWQVGFHLFNALDTRCTGCQSNGANQLYDKSQIGIWFDAKSDETLWAGGGVHAAGTALVHTPTDQNNCDVYNGNDLETAVSEGWGFAQIDGCLQIIGTHTHNAMDSYVSSLAGTTVLQGNYFPNGHLYYENSKVAANTAAVGNTFKNGIVDQTSLAALGIGSVPAQPLTIGSAASGSGMCLYNTSDQTTNFERSCLRWTSNASVMTTEKGGTGTARDLTISAADGKINLQNNGTTKFTVGSNINSISASGAQIGSGAASATSATVVPNRSASPSTGLGADVPGDISLVVGANEDVRFDAAHHTTLKGGLPTATWSTCPIPTVSGNDLVGRITFPTCASPSTSIVLTFNQAWTNSPVCFAQDESTYALNPMAVSAASTTAVTFQAAGPIGVSDKVSYRCLGYR